MHTTNDNRSQNRLTYYIFRLVSYHLRDIFESEKDIYSVGFFAQRKLTSPDYDQELLEASSRPPEPQYNPNIYTLIMRNILEYRLAQKRAVLAVLG